MISMKHFIVILVSLQIRGGTQKEYKYNFPKSIVSFAHMDRIESPVVICLSFVLNLTFCAPRTGKQILAQDWYTNFPLLFKIDPLSHKILQTISSSQSFYNPSCSGSFHHGMGNLKAFFFYPSSIPLSLTHFIFKQNSIVQLILWDIILFSRFSTSQH